MDEQAGQAAIAQFEEHVAKGLFRMVPITSDEYANARRWLCTFGMTLRTVDALHLAAVSAVDAAFLTADRALAQAAKRFNVKRRFVG